MPAGVGMNLSVLIAIRVVLWFTFAHRFFRRRLDVLRHRVTLTYEAEAEEKTPEDIVGRIFDELPVP